MKSILTLCAIVLLSVNVMAGNKDKIVKEPATFSKEDIAGAIFKHEDIDKYKDNGIAYESFTSLHSTDEKFATGMFSSPAVTEKFIDKDYGVDEFMYFITGSVTLTSVDGTVQVINAGEAVTIAKEWRGTWTTEGYTKMWVIYNRNGSALD